MAVTIDKFELLPAAPPAPAPPERPAGEQGAAPPPPSRHDLLRVLREEHARHARVRAH